MAGTILKELSATPQTNGTTVTPANSGLTSVSIGSGNTYTHQSAAAMGRSAGYRMTQGAANELTSYMDLDSGVTNFAFRRPLRFQNTPTANTNWYRFFPHTEHTVNLGSISLTTTRRLQFVEGGSGGLNVTSPSGTPLIAGTDYLIMGLIDTTTDTLDIRVYPYGNPTPLCTISGTLTADMASAAIWAVRDGINTANSGIGNLDTCDGWAIGTGDWLPRYDIANTPPTADAGPDQTVEAGATVTLTGSGTDTDGTITSYAWAQTSGPTVTLDGSGATRTFTAPVTLTGTTLGFELTVTDDDAATDTDTITVTVLPATIRLRSGGTTLPAIRRTT